MSSSSHILLISQQISSFATAKICKEGFFIAGKDKNYGNLLFERGEALFKTRVEFPSLILLKYESIEANLLVKTDQMVKREKKMPRSHRIKSYSYCIAKLSLQLWISPVDFDNLCAS